MVPGWLTPAWALSAAEGPSWEPWEWPNVGRAALPLGSRASVRGAERMLSQLPHRPARPGGHSRIWLALARWGRQPRSPQRAIAGVLAGPVCECRTSSTKKAVRGTDNFPRKNRAQRRRALQHTVWPRAPRAIRNIEQRAWKSDDHSGDLTAFEIRCAGESRGNLRGTCAFQRKVTDSMLNVPPVELSVPYI